MAKRKSRSKKAKKFRIELTPFSIFLGGVILFFVLSWIFVLGILVGRGFLPGAVTAISDLKAQIGKLQVMVGGNKSQDLKSAKTADPDPKLAFYEKLSVKKDEAKVKGLNKKAIKRTPERPTPKNPSERQESQNAENPKKPIEPAISGAQYTVQIASLDEQHRAEQMITQLIDRGHAAYFYKVEVKGKTYYRVRCGRFMDKGEARNYARQLEREEGIKGFVAKIE